MFNFINVLKKIDSDIDVGVNKYTSACDYAERKVMNKVTKKDIMIDDALDMAADKATAVVTEDVVPFVKNAATTVGNTVSTQYPVIRDTVASKLATVKERITSIIPGSNNN